MRKKLQILYVIFIFAGLWANISTLIQAFKCPKMTQTELFNRIPKSFVGNFKTCEL